MTVAGVVGSRREKNRKGTVAGFTVKKEMDGDGGVDMIILQWCRFAAGSDLGYKMECTGKDKRRASPEAQGTNRSIQQPPSP